VGGLPVDARWTTCFDIGNAARVGARPREAEAAALPYCVMSHLRNLTILAKAIGQPRRRDPPERR
jgi:hypothetical protein